MKEKLTLQDLVDLLAKKTGMTKKEADAFFREFFAVITENIFNNESVKIKDFGTFKLTNVNSRESVNVNTGEKIEIPAHQKLSFLPDKSLKELLNKPFEQFETTLLEDSVSFDSIETSEEPVESGDDEDTAIDEIEIAEDQIVQNTKEEDITETSQVKEEEIPQEEENANQEEKTEEIIIEKNKVVEKQKTEIKQPSFVYTYKNDSKEHRNTETITINIPKDKLTVESAENITPSVPSVVDIHKISDESTTYDEPESDIPLDINKVHEKINLLKEAIDSLSLTKQKEDIVIDAKASFTSGDSVSDDGELKNDDKQEKVGIEDISETKEDADVNTIEDSDNVSKDTILDEPISQEAPDDDVNEMYDTYYSEDRDSVWYKIRNRLPVIIFTLIAIAIGAYLFSKLFEQKNIYDTYSTQGNEAVYNEETLPDGDENATIASGDSSFLDIQEAKVSQDLNIKSLNKATQSLKEKSENIDDNNNKFPITEKISAGSSLRLISKKHYGYNAFWVYIYEENRQSLSGYDNLVIGQTITIPNLKKYGVDINDPQSIKKAKEIEQKLFAGER